MRNRLGLLAILLLLWNPITLWLLTGSIVVGIIVPALVLLIGFFIAGRSSLRLKVWAFNICTILSICYHAELVFRTFGTDKDIPNLYELHGSYYFNRPNLDQKFRTEEYVSRYRTNVQGYRIDALTNQRNSIKQCDWMFIGDSFTQGAQVDYADLFSSLVYRDFPDKTIVNAGISGAGLYDELNFFKDKGSKLNPKVVFLQIGVFNDFVNVKERKATFQDYLLDKSSLYRYLSFNIFNNDQLPLGRWTEPFFPNLEDNIDGNILYKPTSERKEQDKANFALCIQQFKNEVEKNGGKLVLLLIPSKEQVSDKMLDEVINKYGIDKNDLDLWAADNFCDSVAKANSLQMLNLHNDFKSSSSFPFFLQDEHMNVVGHRLIAESITKSFGKDAHKYEYMSEGNKNERYPTLNTTNNLLLYQSQTEDFYQICRKDIWGNSNKVLWSSVKELVHPTINSSDSLMAFTEGNQDKSQTDVILYDFMNDRSWKVNKDGTFASIPTFNRFGNMLVYAEWKDNSESPYISGYDILLSKTCFSFSDGAECWRPIFSYGGDSIYYISKEQKSDKFAIKTYSIATGNKSYILKVDYDIWDIALSPTGKFIAYAGNKDGNWDLFFYEIETRKTRQLTKTIGDEWDPSFGATDNELWFAGVFGINNGIYRMIISR